MGHVRVLSSCMSIAFKKQCCIWGAVNSHETPFTTPPPPSVLNTRLNLRPIPKTQIRWTLAPSPTTVNVNVKRSAPSGIRKLHENEGTRRYTTDVPFPQSNLINSLMGPPGYNPDQLGEGLIGAWAALGLGALCYFGLQGAERGTRSPDQFLMWQVEVRERIRRTYAYFGSSVLWTGISATFAFRSRKFMRTLTSNSWAILGICVAAQIISGIITLHMNYEWGFSWKQLSWIVHTLIVGVTLAPVCYFGGAIMVRAFVLYGGIMGGLSLVAYCAPDQGFLMSATPVAITLGFIFASTVGSFLFPGTTRLGVGLMALYLYGGLILFSVMLIRDTHKIMREAEEAELTDPNSFDPINHALGLYMDALNIFVRLMQLMGAKELKKRREN